jgi:hypothetical protein
MIIGPGHHLGRLTNQLPDKLNLMEGENSFRDSLRGFSTGATAQTQSVGSKISNFFQRTTETGSESLQGLLGGARDAGNTGLASLGLGTARPREDDADFWGLSYFQRFIVFGACTIGGIFCFAVVSIQSETTN